MQLSKIQKNNVVKTPIRIDEKCILIVVPDTGNKIWNSIYNANTLINNCSGLICPNKMWTIFRKKFNGKHHYLDVRKRVMENKDVTKKLRVLTTIPGQIKKAEIKEKKTPTGKEYIFYDASMIINACDEFHNKKGFSDRKTYKILLNELSKLYKNIKYSHKEYNIHLLFHLNNNKGFIFNLLNKFKSYKNILKEDLQDPIFDKYAYAILGNITMPILETEGGIIQDIRPNVAKLNKYIDASSAAQDLDGQSAIEADPNNSDMSFEEQPPTSLATTIVKHLADPNLLKIDPNREATKMTYLRPTVTEKRSIFPSKVNLSSALGGTSPKQFKFDDQSAEKTPKVAKRVKKTQEKPLKLKVKTKNDQINLEHDPKVLAKVLKKYKVNDPNAITNIKIALDKYFDETGKKATQDAAELIVLKAIHYTIHGTDVLNPEYLKKPGALFHKLSQLDVYKTKLNLPEGKVSCITPKDIVILESTTGQHRQKYEFEEAIHENIKKVFKTLETQTNHPIKVKSIKWEYKDNVSERYINYKITLQNMTSKNKKPYDVEIKIPAPINDKYFKLNGNQYIFISQQHMKVLTKTDKNEVRILTNYAIVRLGISNLKFNISDVNDIAQYVHRKYPNIIDEVTKKSIKFNSGEKANFTGNYVIESEEYNVVIDDETNKMKEEKSGKELKSGRFELIYELILNKIQEINPEDKLTRTKKSIPYIYIYLGGTKIPYILYMWTQKGLLPALNTFGIDYYISDNPGKRGELVVSLADKKFLYITPKTIRERLIVNGLFMSKPKYDIKDLNSIEEIRDHIIDTYGSRAYIIIEKMTQNLIDPISKELLEFEGLPTNLPALTAEPAMEMLLNKKQDSLSDLKIYRSRMSEIVLRLLYKQLMKAHSHYYHLTDFGQDDTKLMLVADFVINEFLSRNPPSQSVAKDSNVMVQETQPVENCNNSITYD